MYEYTPFGKQDLDKVACMFSILKLPLKTKQNIIVSEAMLANMLEEPKDLENIKDVDSISNTSTRENKSRQVQAPARYRQKTTCIQVQECKSQNVNVNNMLPNASTLNDMSNPQINANNPNNPNNPVARKL